MRRWRSGFATAALCAACSLPDAAPLPPDSFAFGVFGDGPYRAWEVGRFRRLIDDVNGADLTWLLHIGDILWYPCSSEAFVNRRDAMNSIRHPVVYTPGDNEWADCHEAIAGEYQPLERLQQLRAIFFDDPEHSLGGRLMPLESQGRDSAFADFAENARWRRGGFVFATVHMVGSGNASDPFQGRSAADDREVADRTRAAIAWMEDAFAVARADTLNGVVLAMHGNPFDGERPAGYEEFVDRLAELVKEFAGQVLMIHGDWHEEKVDHPLRDRDTGELLSNFTRLETYGSPDIGWVRVVVDSVAGRIVGYEPRLMRRRWWLW